MKMIWKEFSNEECSNDGDEEVPKSDADSCHKFFLLSSDSCCFYDVGCIHKNGIDACNLLKDGQHHPSSKRSFGREESCLQSRE